MTQKFFSKFVWLSCLGLIVASCATVANDPLFDSQIDQGAEGGVQAEVEAIPTRPAYEPGTLVEYIAQTGDTLPGLAGRFNTTMEEIFAANPIIPEDATTMPPGFPMQIPIYYRAFWGSSFQIIPDGLFVNGPAQVDFNATSFADSQEGWFKDFNESAAQQFLSGAEIVDIVSTNFSISPRLLLALMEYGTGAFSSSQFDAGQRQYPLSYEGEFYEGVYLQLVWAANTLNNGYYGWRTGKLIEFDQPNGNLFRPDPWQNSASVALQYFYSQTLSQEAFEQAIGPQGLQASYATLFGDPWAESSDHIGGSLRQPELRFPFVPDEAWSFTGGPHTGWGEGAPWAAMDFAPALESQGCLDTDIWATAVAAGLVVRTDLGSAVLDLDGDGEEGTGWVIFYLHLDSRGRAQAGDFLEAGQAIGHPSCEGGSSTGTHVHVARKYNGEWMPAAGANPFVMEGWEPHEDQVVYLGRLTKQGQSIIACTCSDANSFVVSRAEPVDLSIPDDEGSQ
jgi:murein DD-endopeptidase MepM/ murein hydrolase activator NlpD